MDCDVVRGTTQHIGELHVMMGRAGFLTVTLAMLEKDRLNEELIRCDTPLQ